MRFISPVSAVMLLVALLLPVKTSFAETSAGVLEQAMSETLDLWREGNYEKLFERLAHRGKTSKEQFVKRMRDASAKPVCCFQKMENFKMLNEKRTEATVYVKIGLEGGPHAPASSTREFKLTHEEDVWKMQLNDVFSLARVTAKKNKHATRGKHNPYK